jgi:hypothetical protein
MYIIETKNGTAGDTKSTLKFWSARTEYHLLSILGELNSRSGRVIFSESTPASELDISGLEKGDAGYEYYEALISTFGAKTPIYQAEYLIGDGVWQSEPIKTMTAAIAFLNSDSWTAAIYQDDESVKSAFEAGKIPKWLIEKHFS